MLFRSARELPLQAICSVLGVPQEDRAHLVEIVDKGVAAETGEVIAMEYIKQLSAYAQQLLTEKRANPADDILSVIVHASLDDGTVDSDYDTFAFTATRNQTIRFEATAGGLASALIYVRESPSNTSQAPMPSLPRRCKAGGANACPRSPPRNWTKARA